MSSQTVLTLEPIRDREMRVQLQFLSFLWFVARTSHDHSDSKPAQSKKARILYRQSYTTKNKPLIGYFDWLMSNQHTFRSSRLNKQKQNKTQARQKSLLSREPDQSREQPEYYSKYKALPCSSTTSQKPPCPILHARKPSSSSFLSQIFFEIASSFGNSFFNWGTIESKQKTAIVEILLGKEKKRQESL